MPAFVTEEIHNHEICFTKQQAHSSAEIIVSRQNRSTMAIAFVVKKPNKQAPSDLDNITKESVINHSRGSLSYKTMSRQQDSVIGEKKSRHSTNPVARHSSHVLCKLACFRWQVSFCVWPSYLPHSVSSREAATSVLCDDVYGLVLTIDRSTAS